MISLSYVDKELDAKLDRYYKCVTKGRHYINEIDILCQRYFDRSFKELVLLKPEEIIEFKNEFDSWSPQKRGRVQKEFKEIPTVTGKKTNYIVNTVYNEMPSEARCTIYELANTKTCPYCNRNYIDIVKNDSKGKYISFFDLDHFCNKVDYPMLAVSAFNLIPTCPVCNRIKGKQPLKYYPYDSVKKASSSFEFSFGIIDANLTSENDISIEINCNDSYMKDDNQTLYLQELYSNHKDVAIEVIQKARFHGMGYMNSLLTQLKSIFLDDKEIYRMIYGNYLNDDDWNKRPLSKYTYDIARETLAAYGINL